MMSNKWKIVCKAILSDKDEFNFNKTWQAIYDDLNIGKVSGHVNRRIIRLSQKDKSDLALILKNKYQFDVYLTDIDSMREMARHEVLSVTNQDKWTSRGVKSNRIAIKAMPGCPLLINGESLKLLSGSHLDIDVNDIHHCQHDSILVIENYSCLIHLDSFNWDLGTFQDKKLLVIYRGDYNHKENYVRQLMDKLKLPVFVMSDFDPKGLSIAQSFPEIHGYVGPTLEQLAKMYEDGPTYKPNQSFYDNQYAGVYASLEASPYDFIQDAWALMKVNQSGFAQESWLTHAVPVTFNPLNRVA